MEFSFQYFTQGARELCVIPIAATTGHPLCEDPRRPAGFNRLSATGRFCSRRRFSATTVERGRLDWSNGSMASWNRGLIENRSVKLVA